MKKSERIEWIDVAKGLSIILVVYCHAGLSSLPYHIGDWFGAFRMPFFFIVSGLFFAPHKYPTFKLFLSRRWPVLIRPFLIFSAIVLLGYWYLDPPNFGEKISTVLLDGWGGYALWFIPVLIVSQILFFVIENLSTNRTQIIIGIAICGIAGYLTSYFEIKLPHNLCFSLTASMFYGLGYLLGPWLKLEVTETKSSQLILLIALMLLVSLTFLFNEKNPEFATNKLVSLATYSAAFGGAIMMCGISILFCRITSNWSDKIKQVIIFFGKNSYIVLAFHQIILLLLWHTGWMPNGTITRILMWGILYLIIWIVNTFFPYIVGKKRQTI